MRWVGGYVQHYSVIFDNNIFIFYDILANTSLGIFNKSRVNVGFGISLHDIQKRAIKVEA